MRTLIAGACMLMILGGTAGAARAQQPPAPVTREQQTADLVKKLGDASFEVREAAQRQLEALGASALPALDEASKNPDPEVASRATEAASRIRAGGGAPPRAPGSRPVPQEVEPEQPPLGPGPGPQDMDEIMRDLERQLDEQLPDGMGKLFRDMMRGRRPGQPDPGEQEQPGVRVWTWRSGQQGPQVIEKTPLEQLGIVLGPATPALRAQLGIAQEEGMVVENVLPGTWAQQQGLERYDVLVGLDGRSVRSSRDLLPMLQKATTLELYRRAALQKKELPAPGAPAPQAPPAPPGGQRDQRSF